MEAAAPPCVVWTLGDTLLTDGEVQPEFGSVVAKLEASGVTQVGLLPAAFDPAADPLRARAIAKRQVLAPLRVITIADDDGGDPTTAWQAALLRGMTETDSRPATSVLISASAPLRAAAEAAGLRTVDALDRAALDTLVRRLTGVPANPMATARTPRGTSYADLVLMTSLVSKGLLLGYAIWLTRAYPAVADRGGSTPWVVLLLTFVVLVDVPVFLVRSVRTLVSLMAHGRAFGTLHRGASARLTRLTAFSFGVGVIMQALHAVVVFAVLRAGLGIAAVGGVTALLVVMIWAVGGPPGRTESVPMPPALERTARSVLDAAGLANVRLRCSNFSKWGTTVNAYASVTLRGPVIDMADTLADAPEPVQRWVVAHEAAHLARRHPQFRFVRAAVMEVLAATAAAAVMEYAAVGPTRHEAGQPNRYLVYRCVELAIGWAALRLTVRRTRRGEVRADADALELTRDPEGMRQAIEYIHVQSGLAGGRAGRRSTHPGRQDRAEAAANWAARNAP